MKCGLLAAKELAEYLREMSKIQEDTAKAQIKMVKQISSTGPAGTFSPMLMSFKGATEKLASIHNVWMIKLNDLVKEVLKYTDELHRTHKKVKDEESTTLEAVKNIQETTALLQKSKESYKQRCLEVEKLKRDNVSVKELEKSEAKFRKAQEEYKALVDKYCLIRDEFEKKMTLAAKHFQEVESSHLKQMRDFVETYCQIVDDCQNQWGRVRTTIHRLEKGLPSKKDFDFRSTKSFRSSFPASPSSTFWRLSPWPSTPGWRSQVGGSPLSMRVA